MFMRNRFQLFFAPSDTLDSGTPTAGMDKEEVIEFLGDDDSTDDKEVIPLDKEDKGKTKDKDKDTKTKEDTKVIDDKDDDDTDDGEDDEEVDELKELEDELEPPTEEQLELVTPVRRREILKKYPALFKDFPYLEKAYYREQQFTELLPTIDDARAAVESKKTLDKFETDLEAGNTETILKAVRSESPKAFNKIVDDYLPTLARVDEKAYHHVIGNTIRHTIIAMVTEGRRNENSPLEGAAQILNQFVFGNSDFKQPSKLSVDNPAEVEKDNGLKLREEAFTKQRFEASRSDLNTRVNNSLKNTIDANIDPKQSMTDYVRRTASRDAIETLENLISKDTRFSVLVDKLWERAFSDDFSKASVDKIRSAYFSKAKTLLPSVIKKARNEALRGLGKRVKDDDVDDSKKGPISGGRPRSQEKGGKVNKSEDIPKAMSTLDFLNSD